MKKAIIIRKTSNNCFNLTKNPAWKGDQSGEGKKVDIIYHEKEEKASEY
jgi:hypothetical protein